MTFEERIRACLGPIPSVEARHLFPGLSSAKDVCLRYDWVKDWSAVEGLDFSDASETITFHRPEERAE